MLPFDNLMVSRHCIWLQAFWLLVRFSLNSVTSVGTTPALVLTVAGFDCVALSDMFERACRYSDHLHHVVSLLWSFDRDFKIASSTHTLQSKKKEIQNMRELLKTPTASVDCYRSLAGVAVQQYCWQRI